MKVQETHGMEIPGLQGDVHKLLERVSKRISEGGIIDHLSEENLKRSRILLRELLSVLGEER